MPKFYREAILAARSVTEPTPEVQIGYLETWTEVAEALNGLNPAGRCHAIYSDWLLQLHEPGGDAQIQIRDLLLGQGALAANYLGEMAQNAVDLTDFIATQETIGKSGFGFDSCNRVRLSPY